MRGSTAGTSLRPIGDRPSISPAIDIVLAVNWPPHAPAPGQATSSSARSSLSVMRPAEHAPTASNTSWIVTSLPWNLPGMIDPPYSISPGRSSRASAIIVPGMVLSQPDSATTPSHIAPRTASSIESAITSRDTSDARMPSVPMLMPSETTMVLNSIGVPPAARIPSFTFAPSSRRCRLQGVASVQVFATAMSGFSRSASLSPVAFSIARAGRALCPS